MTKGSEKLLKCFRDNYFKEMLNINNKSELLIKQNEYTKCIFKICVGSMAGFLNDDYCHNEKAIHLYLDTLESYFNDYLKFRKEQKESGNE